MVAQHVYRLGNEWGVTVAEIIARVAAEGLPVQPRHWPDHEPREPFRDDYPTGHLPRVSLMTPLSVPTPDRHGRRTLPAPGPATRAAGPGALPRHARRDGAA